MRPDFPAFPWLLTWVIGVVLFLAPILAIHFAGAVRSLRRRGIPRPAFVVVRRILGRLPLPSGFGRPLEGATAFVAWERRWLDAGETTATIKGVNSLTRELELELHHPIGGALRVTFKPDRSSRAPYTLAGVRGTLSPRIDGVTPAAEVVAYPQKSVRVRA